MLQAQRLVKHLQSAASKVQTGDLSTAVARWMETSHKISGKIIPHRLEWGSLNAYQSSHLL